MDGASKLSLQVKAKTPKKVQNTNPGLIWASGSKNLEILGFCF